MLRLVDGERSCDRRPRNLDDDRFDALTGERLLAAVDRRAGSRRLIAASKPWEDVRGLFDFWSDRLRLRLAELRGAPLPAAADDDE